MPYSSVEAAKGAKFPTVIDDAPLSLKQINHLAEIYDAIKEAGSAKEPMAVAMAQFKELYRKQDNGWVVKKETHAQTYQTEPIDVMGPGTWNGHPFGLDRLERMVKHFAALAARGLKPQVGIGHDPEQRVARELGFADKDGGPSLGEAVKTWFDAKTERVRMVLAGLPEKFAEMVKAGHYKKVSLEIAPEWYDAVEKRTRKDVIVGVKFLGVQWPGFQEQAENVQIAETATFGGEECEVITVVFADDKDTGGGEDDMAETKDLQRQIDDLTTKLATFETTQADEQAKWCALFGDDVDSYEGAEAAIKKLKADFETAKTKVDLTEAAVAEAADKGREERIDEALGQAVKDAQLDVAQKDGERAVLMSMDYTAKTMKFADSDGKETEGTQLDQALAALAARGKIRAYSNAANAKGTNVHTAGLDAETDQEQKVREGFGYVRGEDGEWIEPPDEDK